MLPLPILNVHLQACHENWQQMTPTAQGRHCAHCNREVVDFTHATAADLEAARAAAPDGRLCGRFRQSQLAASRPQLRPKLRRFLVALVLVCGLGLSGREAWAQVRANDKAMLKKIRPALPPQQQYMPPTTGLTATPEPELVGKYYDNPSPQFPGGITAALTFIAQHTRYPKKEAKEGKVFVNFVVTTSGALQNIHIQKGLSPALDAEAIRVIQQMPHWIPAQQHNQLIATSFTVPVTFSHIPEPATKAKQTE